MRIAHLLERQRPVFSFEFFPPKTDEGQQTLRNTLEVLKDDEPNFVSVTYGAGGTTRNRTVEITKTIKGDFGIEAMAHLSCVGEPRERLLQILEEIQASGIQNVLALRGDPPRGETTWTPHPGGLSFSIELIRLIKENFDFCVGAAGFPEVHHDAPDRASDLR
jgi:methylenetetrahydrofolate reductase (NADPH)